MPRFSKYIKIVPNINKIFSHYNPKCECSLCSTWKKRIKGLYFTSSQKISSDTMSQMKHLLCDVKHIHLVLLVVTKEIVSGYVCNHGSPSGERDTASPRGRYGERPQRDSVWRYIWKNTTCWPATAHDVTTGVPQYKCRREDTSSASSSEACVRSMAQSPGDAVSRSPLGEPWLHT